MARIIGDKALNARLTRMAQGADVTQVLVKAAYRMQEKYIEKLDEVSHGYVERRPAPPRVRDVIVSKPGDPPNTDTGDLKNSTGAGPDGRNRAEAWASMDYADSLEFGTHQMAPRPAMKPAFDETKDQVVKDIAAALRSHNRG